MGFVEINTSVLELALVLESACIARDGCSANQFALVAVHFSLSVVFAVFPVALVLKNAVIAVVQLSLSVVLAVFPLALVLDITVTGVVLLSLSVF
jgi:heme/copper-type cytochrome/quinol oxidase subunit 4